MPKKAKMKGLGLPANVLKDFIDLSYRGNTSIAPEGYEIDTELSDSRVKVYTKPNSKEVIIVHRGSVGADDWIDNAKYFAFGSVKNTKTFKLHKERQLKAIEKYGAKNIIGIGHSRAGLYLQSLQKDYPIKEIITYNKAVGFYDMLRTNPAEQTDVKVKNDFVSLLSGLQKRPKPMVEIDATSNPLDLSKAHQPAELERLGDQFIGIKDEAEGGSFFGMFKTDEEKAKKAESMKKARKYLGIEKEGGALKKKRGRPKKDIMKGGSTEEERRAQRQAREAQESKIPAILKPYFNKLSEDRKKKYFEFDYTKLYEDQKRQYVNDLSPEDKVSVRALGNPFSNRIAVNQVFSYLKKLTPEEIRQNEILKAEELARVAKYRAEHPDGDNRVFKDFNDFKTQAITAVQKGALSTLSLAEVLATPINPIPFSLTDTISGLTGVTTYQKDLRTAKDKRFAETNERLIREGEEPIKENVALNLVGSLFGFGTAPKPQTLEQLKKKLKALEKKLDKINKGKVYKTTNKEKVEYELSYTKARILNHETKGEDLIITKKKKYGNELPAKAKPYKPKPKKEPKKEEPKPEPKALKQPKASKQSPFMLGYKEPKKEVKEEVKEEPKQREVKTTKPAKAKTAKEKQNELFEELENIILNKDADEITELLKSMGYGGANLTTEDRRKQVFQSLKLRSASKSKKQRPFNIEEFITRFNKENCEDLTCKYGINSKAEFRKWVIKNHPDKGGTIDDADFKQIIKCAIKEKFCTKKEGGIFGFSDKEKEDKAERKMLREEYHKTHNKQENANYTFDKTIRSNWKKEFYKKNSFKKADNDQEQQGIDETQTVEGRGFTDFKIENNEDLKTLKNILLEQNKTTIAKMINAVYKRKMERPPASTSIEEIVNNTINNFLLKHKNIPAQIEAIYEWFLAQ